LALFLRLKPVAVGRGPDASERVTGSLEKGVTQQRSSSGCASAMSNVPPYAAISHRQNPFSGAYIRAVCAAAGCTVAVPEPDIDKIDYYVHSRLVGAILSKPQINIQAKCERRDRR